MPASEASNTPLAPSVEKAYYRKCIALKRRLNEVEAANDDARIRRLRLDRAIMKMRLERAFLLDELRRRMEPNIDASDGSGDEGMQTPPPDRPYRDKRRRQQSSAQPGQASASNHAFQSVSYQPAGTRPSSSANPSAGTPLASGAVAGGATAAADDGRYGGFPGEAAPPPVGSPYDAPPTGLPSNSNGTGGADEDERGGFTAVNQ